MAIPLGANDLKIYRRHASYCTRYPAGSKKPDTYRPVTKKDQKADTCQCPIWCRGYLAKHTKIVKGKPRPKRLFASLDTCDWTSAEKEVARLYQRGSVPTCDVVQKLNQCEQRKSRSGLYQSTRVSSKEAICWVIYLNSVQKIALDV